MTEVYRDGKVHVRGTQCDHCLLSKDRLVPGRRARAILQAAAATDGGHFICHRNQVSDDPEAICRAWFDRYADNDWMLRLAKHLDIVIYT